ncbi:THO complex subunit 4C-like [Papaver somniferum]|uniref:THO complex subunit 4C-like n=1 Tax=Papaver somniferum TaxID=3469 RepID=UPI000E7015B0|nr:THO complex subunit 4C-like [Papaver somniferum]
MATTLDMALDDIIKINKKQSNNGGRGRGRGKGRQGQGKSQGVALNRGKGMRVASKGSLKVKARPSGFKSTAKPSRTKGISLKPDLFEDSLVAAGYPGIETGTKLYVSNLDIGVTNEDIKELFSEIGSLKRYSVHYDMNGRPNGSAEVVFNRKADGLTAMKRYNNVQLDGKAMKIEIIGTSLAAPVSTRINVIGANGRGKRTVIMTPGMGRGGGSGLSNRGGSTRNNRGGAQRGRGGAKSGGGGGGTGRGRGGGRGKTKPTVKSSSELDAELESYHAEAMQS